MTRLRFWPWLGMGLLLWVLIGTVLYPALSTVRTSLEGPAGVAGYLEFLSSPAQLDTLGNSILLGALTVVCCGVIGTGLAFCVHFFRLPGGRVLDKLLLLPAMMPGIIIVFAFMQLYGESGLITKTIQYALGLDRPPYEFEGLSGILFVHAYTQYVYFYLSVSLAIRNLDRSVLESARTLGASTWRVWTTVIVPSIMPALISAAAMTFMTGIGSFTAPSIIGGGYKVLTTQILLAKANNYLPLAATQVVVLTLISVTFFLCFRWYEKRRIFADTGRQTPFEPYTVTTPHLRTVLMALTAVLATLILLPFAAIIFLSFVEPGSWMTQIYPDTFSVQSYLDILHKRRTFAPFANSLNMSLLAAGLCVLVALPSAYVIQRTRLRGRRLVELLTMLPWAMPGSAVAINLIAAASHPNIFTFNTVLVGTYLLLPVGYFISSLPIVVQTTGLSLHNLGDSLLEASRSLGASGTQTFRRVVLPVLYPGLLAGFLLAFIRSIGEYTMAAFLCTATNKPVSIAMVNAIFEYKIGLAMAYGTLLIGLTVLLGVLVSRFRPAR